MAKYNTHEDMFSAADEQPEFKAFMAAFMNEENKDSSETKKEVDDKENKNAVRKYELTDQTKEVDGRTLYQIRAVDDISLSGGRSIKAGQLGGFIEKEDNLSRNGSAWVDKDAVVYGDAKVQDNAYVGGASVVKDSAIVKGDATVGVRSGSHADKSDIPERAEISGSIVLEGNDAIRGQAVLKDSAHVSGFAQISDHAIVGENAQVQGKAKVSGDVKVMGESFVTEDARLRDHAVVDGSAYVAGDALVKDNAHVGGMTELRDNKDIRYLDDIHIKGNSELVRDERTVLQHDTDVKLNQAQHGVRELRVKAAESIMSGLSSIAGDHDFSK